MSIAEDTSRPVRPHRETLEELVAAHRSPRRLGVADWYDLVGLLLLGVIALTSMGPVYDDRRYLLVGVLGLVIGEVVSTAVRRSGRPGWLAGATVVLIGVLVGPSLIQPDVAFHLVVPTPSEIRSIVEGTVRGWANIVTTTIPIGSAQGFLVLPWASCLLVGATSVWLAARRSWVSMTAIVPSVVLLLAGILIGIERPAWRLITVAYIVVALIWGSYRQRVNRSGPLGSAKLNHRLLGAAGMLVVAGLIGFVLGQWRFVSGDQPRLVVRDEVDPPVDLRRVPSPLARFRYYRSELRADDVAFRVDGLEPGDRLRLAALDDYDGLVWHVQPQATGDNSSSVFERVGERIPTETEGERRTIAVKVEDYTGPWIPSLGAFESVTFGGKRGAHLNEDFRYNVFTDTAAVPEGVRRGDTFTGDVIVAEDLGDLDAGEPDPTKATTTAHPVTRVETISEQYRDYAGAMPEDSTSLAYLRAIERRLSGSAPFTSDPRRGYFSDGNIDERTGKKQGGTSSRPGHSVERMRSMLDPDQGPIVGDEEQFASAMALFADAWGFPTRVVVGFAPKAVDGKTTEVRNRDITAWTEVAVEGHGWVPLLPTPTDDAAPQNKPKAVPPPSRLLPAPTEEAERVDVPRSSSADGNGNNNTTDGGSGGTFLAAARVAGVALAPPVLVLGGLTAIMALLKRRRRNRRRTIGSPADRVSGGWADVCDLATDLGDVVPARATRRESAVMLARPGLASLARTADEIAFGPASIDQASIDRYWTDVATTRAAMLEPISPFGRWKVLVNPTSLRPSIERKRKYVAAGSTATMSRGRTLLAKVPGVGGSNR